jgi:hypothetical protein
MEKVAFGARALAAAPETRHALLADEKHAPATIRAEIRSRFPWFTPYSEKANTFSDNCAP